MFLLSVINNQIGNAVLLEAQNIEDAAARDAYPVPTVASEKVRVMQAFENSAWARYGPIRLSPFSELTAFKYTSVGQILGFKDAGIQHAMLLMRDARRVAQADLLERFKRWTAQGDGAA